MGRDSFMVGREAESDGGLEICERLHLPVEPVLPAGAIAVPPGKASAKVGYAEVLQPTDRVL